MEDDKPYRVYRGSSWFSTSGCLRVAFRDWYAPANRYRSLGLRFFCLTSDLELLASPTRELSNGRR